MIDLGEKNDNQFLGPASEKDMPKTTYRKIDLPIAIIEGLEIKKDQEVTLTLKGKVVGFEDTEYRRIATFEVKQGEIVGAEKKKDEGTLLG